MGVRRARRKRKTKRRRKRTRKRRRKNAKRRRAREANLMRRTTIRNECPSIVSNTQSTLETLAVCVQCATRLNVIHVPDLNGNSFYMYYCCRIGGPFRVVHL